VKKKRKNLHGKRKKESWGNVELLWEEIFGEDYTKQEGKGFVFLTRAGSLVTK